MSVWCSWCGDEFTPIEGNEVPVNSDSPAFCSDLCNSAFTESEEADEIYAEARYGSAPVYP